VLRVQRSGREKRMARLLIDGSRNKSWLLLRLLALDFFGGLAFLLGVRFVLIDRYAYSSLEFAFLLFFLDELVAIGLHLLPNSTFTPEED
jgi:hypothetical protein